MEIILLICSIIFWVIYYFFEGSHDAAFVKEMEIIRNEVDENKYRSIEPKVIKFELSWHMWDSLEKALVKITFSILVFLITDNLLFAIQLLLLSVAVRSIMHDLVVSLKLGKGLNHIGPDFLWWDRFLRRMKNIGINQYLIKLIPTALIIIWILFSII